MSDPVTNVQIEDVLSSIRRLVTEEGRGPSGRKPIRLGKEPEVDAARQVSKDQPAAQPEPAKSSGRLVLTPALRVSEPEAVPEAPMQIGAKFEDLPSRGLERALEFRHLKRSTESKEPAPATEGSDVPFRSERAAAGDATEAPWHDPRATLHGAARQFGAGYDGDFDAPQAGKASAKPAETPASPFAPDEFILAKRPMVPEAATKSDAALTEKIKALEAAIAQRKDQWEPDGTLGDEYAARPSASMPWTGPQAKPAETEPAVAEKAVTEKADTADKSGQVRLTPDVIEAEARGSAEETLKLPEVPLAAQVEDDQTDEELDVDIVAEAIEEAAVEEVASLAGDDSYMDEESLRALVAEIVREELQGALGERITRNVRKLVRREIHRALTSRDLG